MSAAEFFADTLRLMAALLLCTAAWGKWRALDRFRDNLATSFGASPALAALLAPGIAGAELILAIGLLPGGAASRMALVGALLLFALFTAVVAWKYATEDIVKCSCFGDADRSVSGFDLARNLAIIAGIAFSLLASGANGGSWQATVCATGVATLLAVVLANAHDIMMLLLYAREGAV
ncbi:MauE/DoxX family redox-associated membrane protein [Pseudoduganella violaceinigra]|uniref:MauE/DoxX family redox-associated membrane protein n=1 Tax=Pseudoduganella violaceinigra TaxID=246602 RepID=UPI00041D79EC|nr:MauE/DoxX family redox-associated membrane protein [Pseudoduganella violaceinigra]